MEFEYIGKGLEKKLMEVLGMRIPEEFRQDEAGLWATRWFDYRELHPVEATYLFAHHYREQTIRYYSECVDIRTVEHARAFSPDDIFYSRDMTAMWVARQVADRLGVPYPFVMQFAQARGAERVMRSFPRPNQLSGEEFESDLAASWKERLARGIVHSTLPRFKAAAWCGRIDQAQHIDFVLRQVKARGSKPGLIARLVNEGVLDERLLARHFEDGVIHEAGRIARMLR